MFKEEVNAVCNASFAKINFLKSNPLGYFIASMLAGMYVGFGILLIFTIGGLLGSFAGTKIVMGASFGIALSLVIIAGAELFTGNNFVMTVGLLNKKVSFYYTIKLWIICYIGNLIGSILLGFIFYYSGLAIGSVGEFIAKTALTKMTLSPQVLILRGALCNILVCIAVWSSFRCKSDSGKLIMVFWCLFAFITTGFEHSVANMTLMTIGILSPNGIADIGIVGYIYNLFFVTIGNMLGAIILLAIPYYIIAKDKKE